jgi:hypothetical protein
MEIPRSLSLPRLLCLVLLAAGCAGGCRLLRLTTLNPDPPPPREPVAAQDLPGKTQFRVSQFLFYADFEINRSLPLFQELENLHDQVYRELRLPGSNTLVQVYLFEDKARYDAFMKRQWPRLPPRRAFFVAQPRGMGGDDLLVYTFWGERIHQDLRHELTHALLHSVLKDVPLWLDEGLAEYFELPPGRGGVNYQHLDELLRGPGGPFRPDLARLEQLTDVGQMNPAEYREAWAWVHLMLRGSAPAKNVLLTYLHELRTNAQPGPLRPRLLAVVPGAEQALARHIAELDRVQQRPATARR